jgi:hypothetical protein
MEKEKDSISSGKKGNVVKLDRQIHCVIERGRIPEHKNIGLKIKQRGKKRVHVRQDKQKKDIMEREK